MRTIDIPSEQSIDELNRLRKQWPQTGEYPFIIGDDAALDSLLACAAEAHDAAAIIEQAKAVDAAKWLADHDQGGGKSWPRQALPVANTITSLFEPGTGRLRPRVHIGLEKVTASWQLFAALNLGGWNACPEPHIHVALHEYWWRTRKAYPIVVSADVVESYVGAPPATRKDALALAREHDAYCPDIVEQGAGSAGKLASSLLEGKFWYFWWD